MADEQSRQEALKRDAKKKGAPILAILVVLVALLLLGAGITTVLLMGSGNKIDTPKVALGDPIAGRQVFMRPDVNCVFCHSDDGSSGQGPTVKGLWGSTIHYDDGSTALMDDKQIRWTLQHPNEKIVDGFEPRMPNDIDSKLTENDRLNLLAYLRSIGQQAEKK